jgi:hypothetical protein
MQVISAFLKNLIKENLFDPESDVILTPQNINFGCIEMNKVMAQELGAKRGALVHEIVGGFLNHYFAVGDLVLHNKEDYIIEEITENPRYFGKPYVEPSVDLDRWGIHHGVGIKLNLKSFTTDADVDELLSKFSGESPDSEELRKKDSSHKLTLKHRDTGHRVTLTSAGDINSLLFGYAMTVHKAQGCEWNKVFLFLHSSQAVMQFRELIYTAVTRARNHLYIICEPDRGDKLNTLTKAASAPRIKGVTLEEKIDFITKRRKENELFHT